MHFVHLTNTLLKDERYGALKCEAGIISALCFKHDQCSSINCNHYVPTCRYLEVGRRYQLPRKLVNLVVEFCTDMQPTGQNWLGPVETRNRRRHGARRLHANRHWRRQGAGAQAPNLPGKKEFFVKIEGLSSFMCPQVLRHKHTFTSYQAYV